MSAEDQGYCWGVAAGDRLSREERLSKLLLSAQGKNHVLSYRGKTCGQNRVCQGCFLFVVGTLLLMKSIRWTWEKSPSLFTSLRSSAEWKEEHPTWDSTEVGLASCHSSLLSWLQANIKEQFCSPSFLMLPVWIQCVLWVARAASLTHGNCPWESIPRTSGLLCESTLPCPLTESSFSSAGEQQINTMLLHWLIVLQEELLTCSAFSSNIPAVCGGY